MMNIIPTAISGVAVAQSESIADHRGSFRRLYCDKELEQVTGRRRIVQINHSLTRTAGALRGMHFQYPPYAEMKLIRCLRGRVFDVAVDVRKTSPTFLQWHAEELTPGNGRMVIIPEGCAHGFQSLEKDSELLYLHTAFYEKTAEGGLRYDDPVVGIAWPFPVTDISDRDRCLPLASDMFPGSGR
jgi:dTDP-4-dehydrorhamnose 3,5-epimerase